MGSLRSYEQDWLTAGPDVIARDRGYVGWGNRWTSIDACRELFCRFSYILIFLAQHSSFEINISGPVKMIIHQRHCRCLKSFEKQLRLLRALPRVSWALTA